jgi:hypothetical protein
MVVVKPMHCRKRKTGHQNEGQAGLDRNRCNWRQRIRRLGFVVSFSPAANSRIYAALEAAVKNQGQLLAIRRLKKSPAPPVSSKLLQPPMPIQGAHEIGRLQGRRAEGCRSTARSRLDRRLINHLRRKEASVMAQHRLRVYYGPQTESTAAVTEMPVGRDTVSVPLGDVLRVLADAVASNRTWLRDFEDDEITISSDLYEVVLAYQHFRRPSA